MRYAETVGPALTANKVESTTVSETKIAKANSAEAVGNTAAKKSNTSKNKEAATDANTTGTVAPNNEAEARCAEVQSADEAAVETRRRVSMPLRQIERR